MESRVQIIIDNENNLLTLGHDIVQRVSFLLGLLNAIPSYVYLGYVAKFPKFLNDLRANIATPTRSKDTRVWVLAAERWLREPTVITMRIFSHCSAKVKNMLLSSRKPKTSTYFSKIKLIRRYNLRRTCTSTRSRSTSTRISCSTFAAELSFLHFHHLQYSWGQHLSFT